MIGQSVGSDASRLSCFLFRPRKSREKRRKRSHINASNASVIRASTPPAQTPQHSFQGAAAGTHATPVPNRAHSGSQGETGVLWMGALSLPSDRFARSGNPAWPEGRTAYFAPFGSWPRVLPKNAESLRNSDALMRVAVPKASRPRRAALLCLQFGDVAVFSLCVQYFLNVQGGRALSLPSACSACCRNAGRPLVKTAYFPFPCIPYLHLRKTLQGAANIRIDTN